MVEAFSVYWILKNRKVCNPESIAKEIERVLKTNPHCIISNESI